jgi:hypothetical protein
MIPTIRLGADTGMMVLDIDEGFFNANLHIRSERMVIFVGQSAFYYLTKQGYLKSSLFPEMPV